jgi:hypothetical protein
MNRMHPGKPPSLRRVPGHGPNDWQTGIRTSTRILVGGYRSGGDPDNLIREKVIKAAREALSEVHGRELIKPTMSPRPDGKGMQDDYRINAAGVFRIVLVDFDLNWTDPMVDESVMDVVQKELDELLT